MIGNRIQEILDKKGMTQVELSEKTDMSLAHVNRIINGKAEPDKTVAKIAQRLYRQRAGYPILFEMRE